MKKHTVTKEDKELVTQVLAHGEFSPTNGAISYSAEAVANTTGDNTTSGSTADWTYTDTGWGFWSEKYYPTVIETSYPVYYREKAIDKGKQAYEILKALMDKKVVKIEKASDFIEAMDTILKTI